LGEIEEEEREFSDEVADPVLTSVFSEPRDEGLPLPLLVVRVLETDDRRQLHLRHAAPSLTKSP
jgi:hypothetical protein